jgi:hypothetical protein
MSAHRNFTDRSIEYHWDRTERITAMNTSLWRLRSNVTNSSPSLSPLHLLFLFSHWISWPSLRGKPSNQERKKYILDPVLSSLRSQRTPTPQICITPHYYTNNPPTSDVKRSFGALRLAHPGLSMANYSIIIEHSQGNARVGAWVVSCHLRARWDVLSSPCMQARSAE